MRHEYVLSERGRDLFGVLAAINAWGDRWLSDPAGPPVVLHHDTCDASIDAKVVCTHCDEVVSPDDVSVRMGPGFPKRLSPLTRR